MSTKNKNQTYTQCLLRKPGSKGFCEYVAWLPSQFAVLGRYVEVLVDDEWQTGWKVHARYATMDAKYLKVREQDHLTQHLASDV